MPAQERGDADAGSACISGPTSRGRPARARSPELVDLDRLHLRHLEDDELGDPHPRLDDERLVAVGVEQDHLDLAPVARVDQPGRVDLVRPCRAARPDRGSTKPA